MDKTMRDVIRSVRVLSAEQVEKAKSGHPGTPLGAAPVAATLFGKFMKISPNDPGFFDRDRFVLSSGHASALLYSILHVCGFDVKKEDLENFRAYGSRTPGHPEVGVTPGVDCSTGPLGQGVANAVGLALAERMLAAKFNKPGCNLVDHYTYALCGDGCMMEGIENEAASLAGLWKLGKLIVVYDSNRITIEGNTDVSFVEDVAARHKALGWHVVRAGNAENVDSLADAIAAAKAEDGRPSLVIVSSTIGFGAPNAGTSSVHGAPLGEAGMCALKEALDWKCEPFETPDTVKAFAEDMKKKGDGYVRAWKEELAKAEKQYPALVEEFRGWLDGSAAKAAAESEELFEVCIESAATRNICGDLLVKTDKLVPNFVGGSADLAPSNCTAIKGREYYSPTCSGGKAIHFGVREHAMAAVCNGLALHGGLRPFCATFFVFSDYMKYAVRMSAIMKLPVTYILSHDSIGVGEDGPTHQPVEQLASLRSIPGVYVYRPCDGTETAAAFARALTANSPTAIVTSRQKLAAHNLSTKDGSLKGGYVLYSGEKQTPDVILMSSGSEVGLCLEAAKRLGEQGVSARVVSMPCMDLFEEQSDEYKESVLPKKVRARVAVEAASGMCWGGYVGLDGAYVCMDTFGESAPAGKLFEKFGFTAENVTKAALSVIGK